MVWSGAALEGAGNDDEAAENLLVQRKDVDADSKNSGFGPTSLSWVAGNVDEEVMELLGSDI